MISLGDYSITLEYCMISLGDYSITLEYCVISWGDYSIMYFWIIHDNTKLFIA